MEPIQSSSYFNPQATSNQPIPGKKILPVKPENRFLASLQLDSGSREKVIKQAVLACLTGGLSTVLTESRNALKLMVGSFLCCDVKKEIRDRSLNDFIEQHSNYEKIAERIAVTTYEGAHLDGMIIKPLLRTDSPDYVIWLMGLNDSYEFSLNDAAYYANKTDRNILMFNYRGSGDSDGHLMSAKDFLRDTLSIVEFLTKQKGVQLENIAFHGYSLGGLIGTKTAHLLPGTKNINDRSCLVFSKAAKHHISRHLKPSVGKNMGQFLGSASAKLIKGLGFEWDTRELYLGENPKTQDLAKRSLFIFHTYDPMFDPQDQINPETMPYLHANQFSDLKEVGVDYKKELRDEEIIEIGNDLLNPDSYGKVVSFESFKALKNKNLGITDENLLLQYKNHIIIFLNERIRTLSTRIDFCREQDGLLGSDEAGEDAQLKGLMEQLLVFKNLLAQLDRNYHACSVLDSQEAVKKIFQFLTTDPVKPIKIEIFND